MKPSYKSLALSLCALSLASCSDYSSQSSSWWLRYHPEKNEAVYVEIQDSVTADKTAAEPLRGLVAGRRRYPPEGGLIAFDLDEEIDWSDAPEVADREKLQAAIDSLKDQAVVTEAGLYRIGTTGLGFFRVTQIKDLTVFLSDINYLANVIFHEQWKDNPPKSNWEHLELSEETKDRWVERAEKREPWLTQSGATFSLDIPMTEREAAGLVKAVIEDADDFPPDAWFMRALTGVRIADGSLTLSFSPPGQRFESSDVDGDDTLHAGHADLLQELEADPGFIEFDRAKLLERVK